MSVEHFHIIIPARYGSTRFPGKLLMELKGKTVLQRVWEQADAARPKSLCIATDNEAIYAHVSSFGGHVVMTDTKHQSGTERLVEVVCNGAYADDAIIINVQGDEPFIQPELIQQVGRLLASQTDAQVATLYSKIRNREEFINPNVVKLVYNVLGQAMYFSRSPIPAHRDDMASIQDAYKHIGLYAYRAKFLRQWGNVPDCTIEHHECLEQLRIMWAGYCIAVAEATVAPVQDINTQKDLQLARTLLEVE